jgi:hypothetical protein
MYMGTEIPIYSINVKINVEYTWVHNPEANLFYLVKTKGVGRRNGYFIGGNFGLAPAPLPHLAAESPRPR